MNKRSKLKPQTILVSGKEVCVYQVNKHSKEVVLVLHGFMSDATSLQEYIEQLDTDKRIIAPDLPGFGRSERLDEVKLSSYADWAIELCKTLNIEPDVVVGYSFGAYVAVQFLLQHKSKAKMILLCPVVHIRWQVRLYGRGFRFISLRNRSFAEKLYRLQYDMTTLYVRHNRHPAVKKDLLTRRRSELEYFQADVVLSLFTEFLQFNLMRYAHEIKNPTIIITAARDNLASNRATRKFAANLQSKYVTHVDIRHSGHLLPIEEPNVLALTTSDYISEAGSVL